jgi:hypothetical protein
MLLKKNNIQSKIKIKENKIILPSVSPIVLTQRSTKCAFVSVRFANTTAK